MQVRFDVALFFISFYEYTYTKAKKHTTTTNYLKGINGTLDLGIF